MKFAISPAWETCIAFITRISTMNRNKIIETHLHLESRRRRDRHGSLQRTRSNLQTLSLISLSPHNDLTKYRSSRKKSDRLLTSIDEIAVLIVKASFDNTKIQYHTRHSRIKFFLRRVWSHPQNPVLALQPHSYTFLQMFRNERRHPDT